MARHDEVDSAGSAGKDDAKRAEAEPAIGTPAASQDVEQYLGAALHGVGDLSGFWQ